MISRRGANCEVLDCPCESFDEKRESIWKKLFSSYLQLFVELLFRPILSRNETVSSVISTHLLSGPIPSKSPLLSVAYRRSPLSPSSKTYYQTSSGCSSCQPVSRSVPSSSPLSPPAPVPVTLAAPPGDLPPPNSLSLTSTHFAHA